MQEFTIFIYSKWSEWKMLEKARKEHPELKEHFFKNIKSLSCFQI